MRCRAGWRVAVLLLVAGCGRHTAPAVLQDTALEQAAGAGRQALRFGRTAQAVTQYERAFSLALARDDARAIGDCGYDLAVAQLDDDRPAAAQATVLRTRDALAARATPGFAELDLAQAAALHRLGDDLQADTLATRAQATAGDPATIARASYLRGLIAYARGDRAGLAAALDGFGQPEHPGTDWQADHDELAARLDLLRGRDAQAAALAQRSAELHRTRLEYREMAGTLALAAAAMQRAGAPRQAAGLYLQAGESAAARGDAASATAWLGLALMPGADPATRRTARTTLAGLPRIRR